MSANPTHAASEAYRLKIQRIGTLTLASLEGLEEIFDEAELDEISRQFLGLVDEAGVVLVNVRGAERLSSGMVARLVRLQGRLRGVRGRLLICGVSPFLRDVMRQCRLDRVLELFTEEAETLAARWTAGTNGEAERPPARGDAATTRPPCRGYTSQGNGAGSALLGDSAVTA